MGRRWPYFFRDDQDRHVTVNVNRCRSMITNYFWLQLDDIDLEDMWFQQNCATSHTANVTINLFETNFGERVISRNGPVSWQPRSCDLTPRCGDLWGYVKSMLCDNEWWTSYEYRTWNCSSIGRKSSKIGFCVWTSASVLVVAMRKKSSFIHNGSERTFAGIKNFIDIRNRFWFIKGNFYWKTLHLVF